MFTDNLYCESCYQELIHIQKNSKEDLNPGRVTTQGLCVSTKENNLIEEKRHEHCIRIAKIYLQFDFFSR